MAHANNSIITGKFQGMLGKELVFKNWDGKTIVAKAPKKREGEPSAAQIGTQEKFLLASRYAKAVVKDANPAMREAYAAVLRPRQNVYSRALEDFMSVPVIKKIDTRLYSGADNDDIVIRALDDFRVVSVRVEIYSANGALLETGDAEQNANGIDWTYSATLVNTPLAGTRIKAFATDLPGNEGMLEITL